MPEASEEFDLLTDPWIRVRSITGTTQPVSLWDLLHRAPELETIAEPSPLVAFGIYRLLAAVLHQYLELPDEEAWQAVWSERRLPEAFFARVEAGCTGRLRLFDSERPFYQSGDVRLDGKPSEPLKSVGYLAPEAATGTNVVHFAHAGEAEHAFCPACCARGLVQLPLFATAGGPGTKPGINGVPPLYVLPRGETLFHTLLLNYLPPENRPPLADPTDPGPRWEAGSSVAARTEKDCTGFVESLTWPPRRVRLFPAGGGPCSRCGEVATVLVRLMVFAQGWSRRKELPLWCDPWVAYALRKGDGDQPKLLPVRPTEQKDVWRDFPSLFLTQTGEGGCRPLILEQVALLELNKTLPRRYPLQYEVFGLRTDKAKNFEWRQETFQFSAALLASRHAATAIRRALEYAAHADSALLAGLRLLFADTPALREMAAKVRSGERLKPPLVEVNRQDPVLYGARRGYWLQLESEFRHVLLDERLTMGEAERLEWERHWQAGADRAADHALSLALQGYDGDPEAVLKQVCARSVFRMVLKSWKGGSVDNG